MHATATPAGTSALKDIAKRPSALKADDVLLDRVLTEQDSKEYQDLRDRAAYVYVTGSFPTHLRTLMTGLLRKITRYSRQPVSLDGRAGSTQVEQENVERLGLAMHPMVRKTKEFLAMGYAIQTQRGPNERRPYSKVFLYRRLRAGGLERVTVQADGSVKAGWE